MLRVLFESFSISSFSKPVARRCCGPERATTDITKGAHFCCIASFTSASVLADLDLTMAEPVSALEVVLGVVLGGLVLLLVRHYSTGWRGATKSGARLPKGSFGWPIIGETLHFARDPLDYVQSHVKRYLIFPQTFRAGTCQDPEFRGHCKRCINLQLKFRADR